MGSESITEKPGESAGAASGSETGVTSDAVPQGGEERIVLAPSEVTEEPRVAVEPPTYKGFDRVLTFLLLVLVFLLGSFPVINSDILMNLASGRSIAGGEYQFGVDPYSFATQANADQPATMWVNHSWFYSLVLYFLFNLVGESGLVVVHALLGAGLAVVLLRTRDRKAPLLIGVFFTVLAFVALSPRFFLWPMAVSMVLFAIMLHLLYRAGVFGGIDAERVNPRLLWGVPLLTILWVNLDAWFVLAPLTVGFVWAGAGISRFLGSESRVKGKDFGLLFLATLAAGLVNPHLFNAYTLPPELAFVLVDFGLPVPEFIASGGYTLAELHRQQPLTFLLSPLNGFYFSNPLLGGNVAGWSFFALFLVGFMAFLSQFLAVRQEGEAGLQGTRIVPWLFFAGLALRESSLVPWFAVYSGVIGMINMSDWLRQRAARTTYTVGDAGRERLARLSMLLFLVVGLVMAWPGWLHCRIGEFDSARRVAWRFALDPAQTALARQLDELHKAGKVKHVFNFHRDTANYVAWHAPGVRTFLDSRHTLFPKAAKLQGEWKQALWDEAGLYFGKGVVDWDRPPAKTWRDAFREWDIDHIAIKPVADREAKNQALIRKFWLQPQSWTLQFADGSLALFAWGGLNGKKPNDDFLERRTHQVFTKAPKDRCPPEGGFVPPIPPDTWDLYSKGVGTEGTGLEFSFWVGRFQAAWGAGTNQPAPYLVASLFGGLTGQIGGAALGAPANASPFLSIVTQDSRHNWIHFPWFPSGKTLFRPPDFGPPAIPVFLVQDARRNLSAAPLEVSSYLQVALAYQFLVNDQEEYWSNYEGFRHAALNRDWEKLLASLLIEDKKAGEKTPDAKKIDPKGPTVKKGVEKKASAKGDEIPKWQKAVAILRNEVLPAVGENRPFLELRDNLILANKLQDPYPSLRMQLRQMQIMAYQKMAADLRPDDYEAQRNLAMEYRKHYFLDASLEQWKRALVALEGKSDPQLAKEKEAPEKYVGNLEKAVKDRREQFERIAQAVLGPLGKDGDPTPKWERVYDVALLQPYVSFDKGDKRNVESQGRGLPLALLAIHKEMAKDVPGQEVERFVYAQLDLMLRLGRAADVSEMLKEEPLNKLEGLRFSRIRALTAGVLGDYAGFEKHAAEMEKYLSLEPRRKQASVVEAVGAASMFTSLPGSPPGFGWIIHEESKVISQNQLFHVTMLRLDAELVRGLMALEAGDGDRARELFEQALTTAGPFADHPFLRNELNIAQRYLAWMRKE